MMFRDKVHLTWRVGDGGEDDWGNPIETVVEADVLATVWPLGTDQKLDAGRTVVRTRYHMVLAPTVDIPVGIGNALSVNWRGYTGLQVDGSVERVYHHNRLHHYELITKEIV